MISKGFHAKVAPKLFIACLAFSQHALREIIYSEMMIDFSLKDLIRISRKDRKGFHAEIAKVLHAKVAPKLFIACLAFSQRALREIIYSELMIDFSLKDMIRISRNDLKGFSRRDRKGFTRIGCTEIIHRVLGVFLACFARNKLFGNDD